MDGLARGGEGRESWRVIDAFVAAANNSFKAKANARRLGPGGGRKRGRPQEGSVNVHAIFKLTPA